MSAIPTIAFAEGRACDLATPDEIKALVGAKPNFKASVQPNGVEVCTGKAGHATVTIRLYPRPEQEEREKESAYLREHLAEETRRLEAEYQQRRAVLERNIAIAARERVSQGLLSHGECASLGGREMHDLVVVRSERICRIGADLYLSFSVHNRSRATFAIERMEIRPAGGESPVTSARVVFDGQLFLAFDRVVRGVVAWTVDEEAEATAEWTLAAVEHAGRKRIIELDGVGF